MKTYFKYIIFLVLFIVLLSLAVFGQGRGKDQAKAKEIVASVGSIVSSLDFFYNDNNRFPTADEFASKEIMQDYFSVYPDFNTWSEGACDAGFNYTRPNTKAYKLDFCLPSNSGEYKKGWNEIANSK